jgi:hypothetical protein
VISIVSRLASCEKEIAEKNRTDKRIIETPKM